ncbi:MAG: sensor histidine kinase [Rhodanobacter sp.]|jgi:two-component system sensor histidine kinase DesK|nr:sensor histidine kinase [Rhodanobacter sp.]
MNSGTDIHPQEPGARSLSWRSRVRDFFTPRFDELRWGPLWSQMYLLFLFLNWFEQPLIQPLMVWLPATLVSIVVFLPLYFNGVRQAGRRALFYAAAIALIGFVLTPFNGYANNTYLGYALAFLPLSDITWRQISAVIVAGLVVCAIEALLLGISLRYLVAGVSIIGLLSISTMMVGYTHREQLQRLLHLAELRRSHDEIRRLAALAERERIGRDLHDLLGHTLSLITLKSELAARLFDCDLPAARREIRDVERVARDALGQVRRAVTGIRMAGLAAELASARLLLESSDVRLDYAFGDVALSSEIETVFALTMREAVTNIQRHARAKQVRVTVTFDSEAARMEIVDDGCGTDIVLGNGLAGMRERLQILGGRLEIHAACGQGTRLIACVPLRPEGDAAQTDAVQS